MDYKDKNFVDISTPLILNKEINSNSNVPLILNKEINSNSNVPLILNKEINYNSNVNLILNKEIDSNLNINNEILKIKNLINKKYLDDDKAAPLKVKTYLDNDFVSIKNDTNKINCDIKEKTLLINNTIKNQELELKQLYHEKKLLDQNKIQSDIINNQEKLISEYKNNISDLKFNLNKEGKKLEENIFSNRSLEIHNNELKNTISRYIKHNKKLQNNINQLKIDYPDTALTTVQINEMNNKIEFYQEENVRLSSEINSVQTKYETIKSNFNEVELEKNNIYKQIQELNNSLIKNNIVGTPYVKEIIKEDSINTKVLNDIANNNLQENKKTSEQNKDLDDEITDIFN
jgi:chromosome segregation ATPase